VGISATFLDRLQPQLALWRAPIDNDVFAEAGHARRWERLRLDDASALPPMVTTVEPDGAALVVTHAVEVPESMDDLPRVGVRLSLGAGLAAVEWLGGGPHECYSDRRASARVGRWTTAIEDWAVPYVHPQASGNRVGVRWLRFLDGVGRPVLTIDALDDLEVTVSRHTEQAIAAAGHLEDLAQSNACFVWIDARHRGVGSGAVGPDVAPEHRVRSGRYRWSYRLHSHVTP
jgi:beta-galactosidase